MTQEEKDQMLDLRHRLENQEIETLRYRSLLAEARARIEKLEKYIVDELLRKAQEK